MAYGPTWIWWKEGVEFRDLKKPISDAKGIAYEVYAKHKEDLYVTSGTEGNHAPNSLHPHGLAIDIRWPINRGLLEIIYMDLIHELGNGYDVVKNDKYKIFHIEFDPD